MAEIDADIERLELEAQDCNKLIIEAGHGEKSAVDRVESDREGLQGVNMEIQRCRAALEDLSAKDPTEELQREKRRKEEEVSKILESYLPLRIEIKRLKAAQEELERELFRKEGELTEARKDADSSTSIDLMKATIESKRKQLQQQERAKQILEREKDQTIEQRDKKRRDAARHREEARGRADGGEIGEVRETEAELRARQAKIRQERKKIVDGDLGGMSMEEFQGQCLI